MSRTTARIALLVLGLGLSPVVVGAQPFASTGARAAGMGGAFTGVADDASAIYWNPAGLAAGSIVSLVLDLGRAHATPDELAVGNERSSFLFALSTPALGLGYYRLRSTEVTPGVRLRADGVASSRALSEVGELQAQSLVTHHAGATLVQSITQGVAIGSTLKFVRGIAGAQGLLAPDVDAALDTGADLLGRASNRFDLDVGVMAYGGPLKLGLTVRNLTEPAFQTPGDDGIELVLERQARAGLSYAIGSRWLAAADLDLTRGRDAFGQRRDAALGVEGQVVPKFWVRSGLRVNTLKDEEFAGDDDRRAALAFGGSYAARPGLLIDGHYTVGNDRSGSEWGIAARFVY